MSSTTRTAERTDFLEGIIVTAVEGGINYWSQVSGYRWSEGPVRVTVHEIEDERTGESKEEGVKITADSIDKAITAILEPGSTIRLRKDIVEAIATENREMDGSYIDAEIADCIVQVAMFGEVKYG